MSQTVSRIRIVMVGPRPNSVMKYGTARGTVVLPCAHPDIKSRGAFKPVRKPDPKFEARLLRHPLNLGAVTMERDVR
jgi:hypothetical protein